MRRKLVEVYAELCVDAPFDVTFEQKRQAVGRQDEGEDYGDRTRQQEPQAQGTECHSAAAATK